MPDDKSKARKPRTASPVPHISDAEWVVMKVLWDKGPQTTNQVVASLAGLAQWKPKTIHTLLSRLVRKGALVFQRQGREYLFEPRVAAEACEHDAMRSFLGRFFEGRLAPFLARFLQHEKLTPDEISEMKRILDRKRS